MPEHRWEFMSISKNTPIPGETLCVFFSYEKGLRNILIRPEEWDVSGKDTGEVEMYCRSLLQIQDDIDNENSPVP